MLGIACGVVEEIVRLGGVGSGWIRGGLGSPMAILPALMGLEGSN